MASIVCRIANAMLLVQVVTVASADEMESAASSVASLPASLESVATLPDEEVSEMQPEVEVGEVGEEEVEPELVFGHLRGSSEVLAEVMATCSGVSQRSSSFEKAMQQCAVKTFAVQPAAGKCMQSSMGVSASCGKCLGDVLKCSRDYCAQICCGGKCGLTGNCKSCVRAKCAGHFSTCGI